jgi:hypothetical protein
MAHELLNTVDGVVEALGGTGAVARLTKRTDSAVSNWRKVGKFPSSTIFMITGALEQIGFTAPPKLFRVSEFAQT